MIYFDLKGIFINLCFGGIVPFMVMLYVLCYESLVGLLTSPFLIQTTAQRGRGSIQSTFHHFSQTQRRSLQDMLAIVHKQLLHNIEYNTMKCS